MSHPRRIKLRYLLPNLITTGALFFGFFAIINAVEGRPDLAALCIITGMVLDGLDGFAARLFKAQSEFGIEFDSLSDMLTFGAAPAFSIYFWSLYYLGIFGYAIAFLYTLAVCLRLARYNYESNVQDRDYFRGIPSPYGAGMIATIIWIGEHLKVNTESISVGLGMVVILLSILLVSNIRYPSHRGLSKPYKISLVLFIIAALASLFLMPVTIIFFLLYASYMFAFLLKSK